jgi:HEAT repeat protein
MRGGFRLLRVEVRTIVCPMRATNVWMAVAAGLIAASLVAVPARAQISSDQIRQRYDRDTKGTNVEDFVRKMNNDDPEKRLEGVKSLAQSKDPKAIEFLVEALGDSDMRVKAKAIDALGNLRANEATPVLIQHLFLRDTEPYVKNRILASLGKIGDPRATKPIVEFMQRDLDTDTRGTAIFALGEIGSPAALDALAKISKDDPNPTLQRLASEATTKINYHQAMLKTEAKKPADTFLKVNEPQQPPPQ